jgi:hypothetical protein
LQRLVPGLVPRQAAFDQLVDPHLEVKAQLFIDLGLHVTATQVPERLATHR